MPGPAGTIESIARRLDVDPLLLKVLTCLFTKCAAALQEVKDLFVSRAHFEIFSSAVWRKTPRVIVLSSNYMIVGVMEGREIGYYLFGINDNGLLFVNKVYVCIRILAKCGDRLCIDGTSVYLVDDHDIRKEVLGYEVEGCELADGTLTEGMIRLQGDLAAHIIPIEDLKSVWLDLVMEDIRREAAQCTREVILDRIVDVLASHGIFGETTSEGSVIIRCRTLKNPWKASSHHIITRIIDTVANLLLYNLPLSDIDNLSFEIRVAHMYRAPIVEQRLDYRGRGSYCGINLEGRIESNLEYSITITPQVILWRGSDVLMRIERRLRRAKTGKATLTIGRHVVEAEPAYPTRLAVEFKIGNDPRTWIARHTATRMLYVEGGGHLTIKHPEHGTTRYKVKENSWITLYQLYVHEHHNQLLNHITLQQLIPSPSP